MVLVQCTFGFFRYLGHRLISLGVCEQKPNFTGTKHTLPCAIRPDFLDASLFFRALQRGSQQGGAATAAVGLLIASCPNVSHSPPSLFSLLHGRAFSFAEEDSVMGIQHL